MKYFIVILLGLWGIQNSNAQCTFSPTTSGMDAQILNYGDITFNSDTLSICSGESIQLAIDQTINNNDVWKIDGLQANNNGLSETYTNEDSNPSNIEFIVLFENSGLCFTDTLVVKVHPKPKVILDSIHNLTCYNDNSGKIFTSTIPLGLSVNNFSISNGQNTSQALQGLDTGTYYLSTSQYYSPYSCYSDTIHVVITQPDSLIMDSFSTVNDNCEQGTGSVTFHVSGGTEPYTYTLNGTTGINSITTQDSIIHGLAGSDPSGLTYIYNIMDRNGCTVPQGDLFTISQQDEDPPEDPFFDSPISYCPGDEVILQENEPANQQTHFYYFDNFNDSTYTQGSAIILTSNQLETYDSIYIFNIGASGNTNEGCRSDSVVVLFELKDCEELDSTANITTNSFSPNDPLHPDNNTFIIDLSYITNPTISDVKVTIYNRWGDVVYKTENYDNIINIWHGDTQEGSAASEGTYFYTVEIPSINYTTSNWVYLDLK